MSVLFFLSFKYSYNINHNKLHINLMNIKEREKERKNIILMRVDPRENCDF